VLNQIYPTDLTDSQWEHIKDLLPPAMSRGRPRELELRRVVNAIFYLVSGGIQWRLLPREYPRWQSVYYYFRRWRRDGTWRRLHDTLRARSRRLAGRHKHPTAGCLDSQTVRCSAVAGERGYDAVKGATGRKRHVLTDTTGLVLATVVTAASVTDRAGALRLLRRLPGGCKKLRRLYVDGGYRGPIVESAAALLRVVVQAVVRARTQAFVVLPRRWVVERTFAWLGMSRRLSRDYERLTETSEAMIYIAMTRLMLRRLNRS
jgi:putative transposase